MLKAGSGSRLAKGTNLVELVKLLRNARKQRELPTLSRSAEVLLAERVLPTAWYPHSVFLELLELTFRDLLGGSATKAYEMGVKGGQVLLQGSHKALMNAADPVGSLLAMRHAWQAHFNFGALRAEATDEFVTFTLTDYPDVPRCHAYMIAGWGAASARLAGARRATPEVVHGPWQGGTELVYRVTLRRGPRSP